MGEKSFSRITQIAIVVSDIENAVRAWSNVLGVEFPEIVETAGWSKSKVMYRGRRSEARARLAFFKFDNIVLELIEPLGGPSTWKEFLENNGVGLHHIAFNFGSFEEARIALEKIGGEVVQEGKFEGGEYIYVYSRELGTIIELLYSD